MACRAKVGGVLLEADTPEELLALLRAMGLQPTEIEALLKDVGDGPARPVEELSAALEALLAASGRALSAERLAKAAGLPSGRSLSGKFRTWREVAARFGCDLGKAMESARGTRGVRMWRAGPEAHRLLAELRRMQR